MVEMVEWDEKQSSFKWEKSSVSMKGRDGISERRMWAKAGKQETKQKAALQK